MKLMRHVPRIVYALALVGALSGMRAAFADEATTPSAAPAPIKSWSGHHHHHKHGFGLGLCVGQTLAQEGITLPKWTPGQGRPQFDAATKTAFQAAIKACKPAPKSAAQ